MVGGGAALAGCKLWRGLGRGPCHTHARPDGHTHINSDTHTNPNTHATTCVAVIQHPSPGCRPGSGCNTRGVGAAGEGAKPPSCGEQR